MRITLSLFVALAALSSGFARSEEVVRCTTGDHCVNGILVSDRPTAAQIRAIDQAIKANEEAARTAIQAKSEQKYFEPMPGDSEGVTMARAATRCGADGRDCVDLVLQDRRKLEKIWEYVDLNSTPRAKIRDIISKHSVSGATNWGNANSEYNFWLLSTGRQKVDTSGARTGIHSSCTLRTTTTGEVGNQVITSNLDCN